MSKKNLLNGLITLLVLLYCIQLINLIGLYDQWDFRAYYYSTKAYYEEGLNPYDRIAIEEYFQRQTPLKDINYPYILPYLYPPVALLFFWPVSLLNDFEAAVQLYLYAKLVVLVALVYLWRKDFISRENSAIFLAFCVFVYNSTIYIDLKVGNISVFEQLFIWLAFFFYMRRRWLWFSLLIVLISLFKFTPILFLALLLLIDDKKKYYYFFGGGLLFLFLVGFVSYAMMPDAILDFGRMLVETSIGEDSGLTNPSTLTLLDDTWGFLLAQTGIDVAESIRLAVFGTIVGVILVIAWRAYRIMAQIEFEYKLQIGILFACLTYALILPRLKIYSYILLIVPTFFIIARAARGKGYVPLLVLVLLSLFNPSEINNTFVHLPNDEWFVYLLDYYTLIIAYVIWGIYVYKIFSVSSVSVAQFLGLPQRSVANL